MRHFTFVAWVLFGCQCVICGWLIAGATFLPRLLGILLAIGGTTYVAVPLIFFVSPAFGTSLLPVMLVLALLGEGALSLWLLAKGVDKQAWEECARDRQSAVTAI